MGMRINTNASSIAAQRSLARNKENLNDPSFRIAAEASLRAINDPNCSPLNLPIGKLYYDYVIQHKKKIKTYTN